MSVSADRAGSLVEVLHEPPFSLKDTLKSGQLFHWEPMPFGGVEGFAGCLGEGEPLWIGQDEAGRVLTLPGREEDARRYFGLDQSPSGIAATFPEGDAVLAEAIRYCPGLRIARQPVWECLATFITSSLKQVAHIRGISMTLRQRYGEPHAFGDRIFHSYPTPASIAEAGEAELRKCALGYRAKSLALAAEAVSSGKVDLGAVEREPDIAAARDALMQLHGVGEKIANCVLLFSCGRFEAFPIDVWMERVLRERYRKRIKGRKLQAWAEHRFGTHAGYAQQYLFHFARKTL